LEEEVDQGGIFGSAAFLWPAMVMAQAGQMTSELAREIAELTSPVERRSRIVHWATPHRIAVELPTMRLRDFSTAATGVPTLICAPFALHASSIADFAHGHSLVEVLRQHEIDGLFLTDWRSATPEMRLLSIDDYLADLNVAIDGLGGKVDLIGICQGGWMGLLYAARFPRKVRKLVIAGAPIDIAAGDSSISMLAKTVPLAAFADLVELGQGRVIGERVLDLWRSRHPDVAAIREILQLPADDRSKLAQARESRFRDWYAITVDLPGTYYLQVVEWLFKENRLAEGRFAALGRRIDLSALRLPVFLLAARDDEFVAPGQVFGTARLIGTSATDVHRAMAPGSHMALFMGSATLADIWPRIARWLRSRPNARRQRESTAASAPPHPPIHHRI
jgi:poly(3-hydroxybutyrate) depolymerase